MLEHNLLYMDKWWLWLGLGWWLWLLVNMNMNQQDIPNHLKFDNISFLDRMP
jgi:hypothetical protein